MGYTGAKFMEIQKINKELRFKKQIILGAGHTILNVYEQDISKI